MSWRNWAVRNSAEARLTTPNPQRPPSSRSTQPRLALLALLGTVALLSGCAAGAPSIVAPAAPDTSEVLIPVAPEAAPPLAAAPAPTAVADAAPVVVADPVASATEPIETVSSGANATSGELAAFANQAPAIAGGPQGPAPAAEEQSVLRPAPQARAQASRLPPPSAPGDGTILDYYRGPSGRLEVALTFDAGADRGYGAEILNELQAEGILATFGMTGQWAEQNPDLIQRMVDEGHQLINHTWSHGSLTGASTGLEPQTYDQILAELTSTENLIRELTGYELKPYFRPPYGDIGPVTSGYLAQAGYYVNALWSCDSFGWNGFGAEEIVSRCTTPEQGGPGAIILMHVGADAVGDLEALPGLIEYYRANGYAFVTIEQMLQP